MSLYFNTTSSIFRLDPTLENVAWRRIGVIIAAIDGAVEPSYGPSKEPKLAVDIVEFGDGYQQRSPSGVNPKTDVYSLVWNSRKQVLARAFDRFFSGEGPGSIYNRAITDWFWWLPPLYLRTATTASPIRVYCDTWRITPTAFDQVTISATFVQCFQP